MKNLQHEVLEVGYGSLEYGQGLEYLRKRHPNNFHLRACYEGLSFQNLARCILFDRNGRVENVDQYIKRPKRYILKSKNGEVIGVMVVTSLPEFYDEIDYEDYVIIETNKISDYIFFINQLSFSGKAEIVTFSEEQVELVKSIFNIREIHEWSVYAFHKKNAPKDLIESRLMNNFDLDVAKFLSNLLPEESSPYRTLQFQLAGLEYKNYEIPCDYYFGIYLYSTGIFQVNYLISRSLSTDCPFNEIIDAISLVQLQGVRVIWRIRAAERTKMNRLIQNLVKTSNEWHLHLSDK